MWFLMLHRLFRSSSGVREKQKAAYDDFFEGRRELFFERYSDQMYYMMLAIMEQQQSRYISIETIRAVQLMYMIDNQTVVDLLDEKHWCLIDKKAIEEELGVTFTRDHSSEERTKNFEKMIGRTYHGEIDDSPSMDIGELIKSQMGADAACSPKIRAESW
jgi:hypothetical protein